MLGANAKYSSGRTTLASPVLLAIVGASPLQRVGPGGPALGSGLAAATSCVAR